MVIKLDFVQTLSTRFGQEFEVEVQAKLLKLKFGQYFAADVWLKIRSWNLGQDSEARFGQDFKFKHADNWVRF